MISNNHNSSISMANSADFLNNNPENLSTNNSGPSRFIQNSSPLPPVKKVSWFKKHPVLAVSSGLLTLGIVIGLITAIVLNGGLFEVSKKIADSIKQTVVDNSIKAYAQEFSFEAENKDSLGVSSNTKFILKSKEPLTKGQIVANLTTIPKNNFDITEKNSKEFEINTKNILEPGTIQKFELKIENDATIAGSQNLSWAFPVKNEFKVISVLPRNKATSVPVNSGIEIEFNSTQFQSLDSFFSIKPEVKGTFKKYNNRAVFVPNKLEPATLYTVTLKQGLKLEGSDETLKQDFNWQFETVESGENSLNINVFERSFFEYPENTKPSLTVLGTKNQEMQTSLYRFNDFGQFSEYLTQRQARPRWALFANKNESYDLAKLQKVIDAKLPVKEANFVNYIDYPATLERGYYLAVLPGKDSAVIQITNNSTYLSSSETKTVIWANNLATQKPIDIGQIKDLQNNQIAVTGNDGVAFFDTPNFAKNLEKENYYQFVSGDFTSIIPLVNSTRNSPVESFSPFPISNQKNWNYLSLDRSIYSTTDTVNFWGLLKSREDKNLGEIRAELITFSDLINFNSDEVVVQEKTLKRSPVGSFIDNFKFKELKNGSYEIRLYEVNSDVLLTSKSFVIQEITKPVYIINVEAEKEPFLKNQPINFKGKVEYYDKIPVANTVLSYSGDATGDITTDQNGEFKISYLPPVKNTEYYQPFQTSYINIRPKISQEADIEATAFAGYFPYSTYITSDVKIESGKGVADINISKLDTSKFVDSKSLYQTDFKGSGIENLDIKATVISYVYDKIQEGENYNPISKESEPIYRYVRRNIDTKTQDLKTNSQGNSQLSFDIKIDTEYEIKLETKDTDGQNISQLNYLSGTSINPSNLDFYTINQKENNQENDGYSVGQPVNLEIFKNSNIDKAEANDKYLLVKSQNGILDYSLDIKPTLTFNFEQKYIPNINLNGVKFDGKNYYSIENFGKSIDFKIEDRKIDLEIKTDKESYAPGEKVKLTVITKDKDGKPKPSRVNLSAIDEALRYIDPIDPDTSELYRQVGTGINQIYISHSALRLAADSFGGLGNGGQGGRTNFLDTALYSEVETNQEGIANTEFTLPDNITTWRITAQSFSSDLYFGLDVKKVVSTKAIVVNNILSKIYLENDEPVISVTSNGLNLDLQKEATFTVEIPDLKYLETKKSQAIGTEFKLPKLPVGKYNIITKVTLGEISDSIQRQFEVKSSYQNFNQNQSLEIKNPLVLPENLPENQSIQLTIGGKVLTKNYTQLQNIINQNGNRLDQNLASSKAIELLNRYYKQNLTPQNVDYSIFENQENPGLQLLSYSDTDLRLTTMALMVDPERLNNPKISAYYDKLATTPDLTLNQYSLILLGQSLLNKPVLSQIQLLLKQPDLDIDSKLNLSLASISLGDSETARKIYTQEISKLVTNSQFGKNIPGKNEEETKQLTSKIAVIAVKLNLKESAEFNDFVVKSPATSNIFVLEQIAYLKKFLAQNKSEKITFRYSLDGQTKEINLDAGQVFQLLVSSKQLKDLNLNSTSTDLFLDLSYKSLQNDKKPTETLKLTRSYSVDGVDSNAIKLGQIVNVNLKIDIAKSSAIDGCYIIKDYLPSGLKPITNSFISPLKAGIEINYPYQIEGQEITFCYIPGVFKSSEINYLARVISKGNYTADSAIIEAGNNSNVFNTAGKVVVAIE